MSQSSPEIAAIQYAPEKKVPMQPLLVALVLQDQGIEGDRYAKGTGAWSKESRENVPANPYTNRKIGRDVTLISEEAIRRANEEHGTSFDFADTRRNFLVRGIEDLNLLIGQIIVIGSATLFVNEECAPCDRPSSISQKPGFKEAFEKRGGVRAIVLSDGDVEVGDEVVVADSAK